MSHLIRALGTALAEPHSAQIDPAAPSVAPEVGRPDSVTAHSIEVALVVNALLGTEAASDYLARQAVSARTAQRVLSATGRHRRSDDATQLGQAR
ncbi:MAG: hypothetical protein ACJ8GW_09635 [Massilia sp.]